MDASYNDFDVMYLSNPNFLQRFKPKMERKKIISDKDMKFYRKRIFLLTKDYLNGKLKDENLDKIWEKYAASCIDYFKFIDKSEIIQETYKNMNLEASRTSIKKDISTNEVIKESNQYIMNKTQPIPKITDHIKLKKTKSNDKKKIIIPREKNINIKNSKFKNKI
jgi:hypothetical protein